MSSHIEELIKTARLLIAVKNNQNHPYNLPNHPEFIEAHEKFNSLCDWYFSEIEYLKQSLETRH